jgi:hypothetical protein
MKKMISKRNNTLPTILRKTEILFQKELKNRRIMPRGLYMDLILV